ncbi:TrmO family methyltransferase domain-containing protein [Candidatus Lokiarchaeum ossiferum]|uniref:TrmO family methyltransferase domain-containing protein n=1 Tax=Candidatus Lokiarchaeum ossiferum TaxID=2951803 RepID=UPI00352C3A8E
MECSSCGKVIVDNNFRIIDNQYVCLECIYGDIKPFKIFPIGFVENTLRRGKSFHLEGDRNQISKIHLFASQAPFLYKLADEKKIDILFYLNHQRSSIQSSFQRGIDGKKVGVFASRTPDRLTPIAITNVDLLEIQETTLYVKGLDAVDGTPVLDIKLGMNSYR